MIIRDVLIDWGKVKDDSYLHFIEAISGVNRISFNSPVTFFSGENGSGKSTLLEAMAISEGFNPEGGTKNYSFSTFDSHSELYEAVTLSHCKFAKWGFFLRAESFYNVATMEENYQKMPGGRPMHLHEKSHGESFLDMLQKNFQNDSIYFLDEPEAALSPQRQMTLLLEINRCVKEGSQFFIVTHSPILLGFPNAEILSFDNGTIHKCSYEDTSSYQVFSMFLKDRKHMIDLLFEQL